MTAAPHPLALAALDEPVCFVGATGSGKTTAAKGAVEQLLDAGRRVVVLDPTGVWWGLRLRADGAPGYPVVIFGGPHADVPIGADAGARLGRLLAAGGVGAAILDTSDFTTGESIALLWPLFEALRAGLRGALHLVLDEADSVAPQNPMPEGRRLLGVVDKIARQGRAKGFRLMCITQRPAVLNKNVLSQVSTLVAMRLGSPQDRAALDGWIQGNADADTARDVTRQLPGLPVGAGWIWAPKEGRLERVAFPPAGTLDSSRAPEPGADEAAVAPLGAVEVAALRAALAPEDPAVAAPTSGRARRAARGADAIAADPGAALLAGMPYAAAAEAAARARAEGYAEGYADALDAAEDAAKALLDAIDDLRRTAPASRADRGAREAEIRRLAEAGGLGAATPERRGRRPASDREAGLNAAARKMLAVLDTDPPVRRTWPTVARLAVLKASGGHYNLGRRQLLDTGLLVADGALVQIAAPSPGAKPFAANPAALRQRWGEVLGGLAARILGALDPEHHAKRATIAGRLGVQPRGGHWNGAWKALRDNGLVDEDGERARLSSLFRET